MKRIYILFILHFSLLSCFNSKIKVNRADLFLSVSENPNDASYFSRAFEVAEIIPILKNETLLISDIKKVIRNKDIIILLTGNQGHVFILDATTGECVGEIKKWGRGPGESRTILDVAFYEELEQIVIFNDYAKLLFFDLSGEFINEEEVGDLYEEINICDHEVIFHNKLEGYSCYPYAFKIFNIKNKKWRDVGNYTKIDFHIRSRGRNLVKSKQLWFTAPLDYSLSILKVM